MIDLLPSVEQQQIVDSVSSLLGDMAPVSRLTKKSNAETRRDIWSHIANLGCYGLGMPEALGGSGGTVAEETLVFREFGRFVLSPNYLATIIATHVVELCGKGDIAGRLIAGDAIVALAVPTLETFDRPRLEQEFHLLDSDDADFCLTIGADGAALHPMTNFTSMAVARALDDTVTLKTASLTADSPAAHYADGEGLIQRKMLLLVTAMMVGISEASRDMASEYAKVREQFGKPIGTFQAIKHSCADAAVHAQAALSQTLYAALSERDRRTDSIFQINAAYLVASAAARRNTSSNIQVHGGFGYTAECTAHFFLKRYNLLEQIIGPTRQRQIAFMAEEPPEYAIETDE